MEGRWPQSSSFPERGSRADPQAEHLPEHHHVGLVGGTGSSSKLSGHRSHVPVHASVRKPPPPEKPGLLHPSR